MKSLTDNMTKILSFSNLQHLEHDCKHQINQNVQVEIQTSKEIFLVCPKADFLFFEEEQAYLEKVKPP